MKFLKIVFPYFAFFINSFNASSQTTSNSIFHPDSIRKIVEVLASDSLKGRFTGTIESYEAAIFIANKFSIEGLKQFPGCKNYLMEMPGKWYNVVGVIPGKSKKEELIIFSAHYDHVGTLSTNPYPDAGGKAERRPGDSIFNGANDDASGVSAVITLAKYFALKKDNERTLVFVAFTGEELGLLGSHYFVNQCDPDSIMAVINIEMIGRKYLNGIYVTGAEYSDLRIILNKELRSLHSKKFTGYFFNSESYNLTSQNLFERSDNFSFAKKGVPAHSIMVSSPNDIYYHNLGDESQTLDYNLMSNVIQGIAFASTGLINGKETPIRIAPKILKRINKF